MKFRLTSYIRLFFIIIFTFVLLETALFLYSHYLLSSRRGGWKCKKDGIQIVCLGDSHTFGVGTSSKYSYPKLLETLLNYNNAPLKFSVVNLGVPGASTRRQFEEPRSFFAKDKTRTKIVILLTGRNNDFEIKSWNDSSLLQHFPYRTQDLKSIKFLQALFNYVAKKEKIDADNIVSNKYQAHNAYLNFWLQKIKGLCFKQGARMVLLSYYNSQDRIIKEFANRNNVSYFDFTEEFKHLFTVKERRKYLSADMSHMNSLGYKFFAEQLYEDLFLSNRHLGFKINPLIKRIQESSFYANKLEVNELIALQIARVERYRDSKEYPFELIHLGHIYMEANEEESAKKFYLLALAVSNYLDNNTIVSPIINWYLKNGQQKDAQDICEEILKHNPSNSIAKHYRDWLLLASQNE